MVFKRDQNINKSAAGSYSVTDTPEIPQTVTARVPLTGRFLDAYKDVFPLGELDDITRLKGDKGGICSGVDTFGSWIRIGIHSLSDKWIISTWVNDELSKQFVKFSNDGIYLDSLDKETGEVVSVKDYVADLKARYPKASSERYIMVLGRLLACEKETPCINKLVLVELSETSIPSFNIFATEITIDVAEGFMKLEDADKVTFRAKVCKKGSEIWTKIMSSSE